MPCAHIGVSQWHAESRVLAAQVLAVAATAWDAVHVDRRPEHHVGALGAELSANGRRPTEDEGGVPAGGRCQGRRKGSHLPNAARETRGRRRWWD